MRTSLRRAGTLGEAADANKPAQRRAFVKSAMIRPLFLDFRRRRRGSLGVSKSFTPIGDRLAAILQRTGYAGAKSAIMNYAPVYAASHLSSPVARYDKAMRLYLLRSLLSPIVSARWAQFIRRYYRRFEAGPPPARVLLKPVRSYVHLELGPARRFEVLRDHYRLFRRLFSRDCVRRVCAGDPIVVAELAARKGGVYRLAIAASTRVSMQREGELAIYLVKRGVTEPVSKLSLALAHVDGRLAVLIGGLQGPSVGHKREVIDATRELYGLRPKDATLIAARAFAEAAGATSVHAIANSHHVLARLSGAAKHADYDAYWRERGAAPGGPLGFVFPPLGKVAAQGAGRAAAKAAIVGAMHRFVTAHARAGGARAP
jgi:uncharacterized protein VirK/YbjX